MVRAFKSKWRRLRAVVDLPRNTNRRLIWEVSITIPDNFQRSAGISSIRSVLMTSWLWWKPQLAKNVKAHLMFAEMHLDDPREQLDDILCTEWKWEVFFMCFTYLFIYSLGRGWLAVYNGCTNTAVCKKALKEPCDASNLTWLFFWSATIFQIGSDRKYHELCAMCLIYVSGKRK